VLPTFRRYMLPPSYESKCVRMVGQCFHMHIDFGPTELQKEGTCARPEGQ
jgi:hypothetical protein